jgi:hypothetical protein
VAARAVGATWKPGQAQKIDQNHPGAAEHNLRVAPVDARVVENDIAFRGTTDLHIRRSDHIRPFRPVSAPDG